MNTKIKRLIALLLLPILCLHGCTFSYNKSEIGDNKSLFDKINELAEDHSSTVTMLNGEEFNVDKLFISKDSTTWKSINDSETITNTSEIHTITFRDRWKGAWGGITIGVIIGTVSTIGILFASPFKGEEAEAKRFKFLIGVPTLCLITGAVVGGLKSEKSIFIINDIEGE